MDIERAINALNKVSSFLQSGDFETLFSKVSQEDRGLVYEFLVSELGIDPLPEMETLFSGMFMGVPFQKISIPDNIINLQKNAFSGSTIKKVKLGNGIKNIPERCFTSSRIEQLYIPESVKKIGNNAFDSSDIQVIVTPWRERKQDKLSIPTSEIDFYKEHLRFQHKPKDEPVIDGTNQGEDA